MIFFAYRLKCNCFPGSRLLRIALKYERIKFEISHQKFSDKHFRLSNQDGIIAKKGVVNKSTMSSYGLNGKKFLQGCKGFYFRWIWHRDTLQSVCLCWLKTALNYNMPNAHTHHFSHLIVTTAWLLKFTFKCDMLISTFTTNMKYFTLTFYLISTLFLSFLFLFNDAIFEQSYNENETLELIKSFISM